MIINTDHFDESDLSLCQRSLEQLFHMGMVWRDTPAHHSLYQWMLRHEELLQNIVELTGFVVHHYADQHLYHLVHPEGLNRVNLTLEQTRLLLLLRVHAQMHQEQRKSLESLSGQFWQSPFPTMTLEEVSVDFQSFFGLPLTKTGLATSIRLFQECLLVRPMKTEEHSKMPMELELLPPLLIVVSEERLTQLAEYYRSSATNATLESVECFPNLEAPKEEKEREDLESQLILKFDDV